MIAKAKDCGFWGVKFQLFRYEFLFRSGKDPLTREQREARQLDFKIFARYIVPFCQQTDINVGVTPFDIEHAEKLAGVDIDFVKISSFDVKRFDLMDACARLNKPLMISTGLATVDDVLDIFGHYPLSDLIMLYCVSLYPSALEDLHMKNVGLYRNYARTGYSDHARKDTAIYAAQKNEAEFIEVHVDLDGQGAEYPKGHCWLFDEIAPIIKRCKEIDVIDRLKAHTDIDLSIRASAVDGLRPEV